MKTKQIDENRMIRDDGSILQIGSHRGTKPVGTVWKPRPNSKGYANVSINGKTHQMHRLMWSIFVGPIPEGVQIDHRDGDPLNNNISNLRLSTHVLNLRSFCKKRKGSTSKYRGVSWSGQANRWQAQIGRKYIGRFNSETDAARAYNAEAIKKGFLPEALNAIQTTV